MDRASLLDKIKGLLCKTVENGCTPQEAASAFAKAQSLMDEHRIARADLDAHAAGGTGVLYTDVYGGPDLPMQVSVAIEPVEFAFGVRAILLRMRSPEDDRLLGVKVTIFGNDEPSIESASWGLRYLSETFEGLWTRYRAATGAPARHRQSYLNALGMGVLHRLQEDRAARATAAKNQLARMDDRLDQAVARLHPDAGTEITHADLNEAALDGYLAGREITLARHLEATADR